MELVKIIFIAVLQGIAEFLPISSSGHVVVVSSLTGFSAEDTALLNAVVHAGTLCSIIVFYFKMLWDIVIHPRNWKIIGLVFIASIPAGVAGVVLKMNDADDLLNQLPVVAAGFFVTAAILYFWGRPSGGSVPEIRQLSWWRALLIGVGQMIAIVPGISRAGTTISTGQRLGLNGKDAAAFSFLMGAVVIGGPFLLEIPGIAAGIADGNEQMIPWYYLASAFVVAALVGYFSLKILIKVLDKGKFRFFAWYLAAMGVVTTVLSVYKYLIEG